MIIHLNDNGGEVDKNFAAGEKLGPQPRIHAGLLSTRTALPQIGDKVVQDDSATLNWSTSNENNITVQPLGAVASAGNQVIQASPTNTGIGRCSASGTKLKTADLEL